MDVIKRAVLVILSSAEVEPSGVMPLSPAYAALMGDVSYTEFMHAISIIVEMNWGTATSVTLTLTDAGRDIGHKVNAALAA